MAMKQPTVAVIMPCYQQEAFVADAIQSILAQDYQPLEIIVSDDASTDQTGEIVKQTVAAYHGPHSARWLRRKKNSGTEHFNMLRDKTTAEFLVVAHGDDIAYPHRVRRLVEAAVKSGASLVTSNAHILSDVPVDRLLYCTELENKSVPRSRVTEQIWTVAQLGATMAFRRDLLDDFPPFKNRNTWQLMDNIIPFRAIMKNGIHYVGEPLLQYRDHAGNMTNNLFFDEDSSVGLEENALARQIALQSYRLQEFSKYRANIENTDKAQGIYQETTQTLVKIMRRWRRARNNLLREGQRSIWLNNEELAVVQKFRDNQND